MVVLYATAMAWVESAVVFYLRTMMHRIEPYQPNPLPYFAGFGFAELVREFSTLVMLFTVGWMAGRNGRQRFGYMLLAFGVWDIGYYLFLIPLTGWPRSLFDWDILFLIPLPWWGPVLAPVLIAILMIFFGTLVTQAPGVTPWPSRQTLLVAAAGILVALAIFMSDAWDALPRGEKAVRGVLPVKFNWPHFLLALGMMAAPVIEVARQIQSAPEPQDDQSGVAPEGDALGG